MSKKEVEEQRKKEQEQAAAQAFEEFVATFQESSNKNSNKVWVKAGTYDAGKRRKYFTDFIICNWFIYISYFYYQLIPYFRGRYKGKGKTLQTSAKNLRSCG